MKKLKTLSVLLVAVALVTFLGVKVVRAQATQVGVVEGLITGPGGTGVDGASVSVDCNGNTQSTTSGAPDGFYMVTFPSGVCVEGDMVTVTATKDGLSGTNTGEMQNYGATPQLRLDVAVVNVPMVPEFGLITGAIAMITSAGSMLVLKRRV